MKFMCVSLVICAALIGKVCSSRLDRWVRTGFHYLKLNLCLRVSLPESECKKLSHLHLSGVAVYVSESSAGKVFAILPDPYNTGAARAKQIGYSVDSSLDDESRTNEEFYPGASGHDAVLLLDLSLGESSGHPLVTFYVDFNITEKKCSHMHGIYLGEECLTMAVKTYCQNQLKWRRSRSDRMASRARRTMGRTGRVQHSSGLCEIHFLPLVVGVKDINRTQRLRCVDHPDFARCPQPLPMTSPSLPISSCELSTNSHRCQQQRFATHLSCRLYQTCDHAVLLSGGWQEQITHQHHVQNLQLFYQMLRNNGFHKDHIKTFFAGNGQVAAKDTEGMYPATEKDVIRKHISYICRKQHCADSLVLYLNSPTRNDGTMLLWDRNNNGIADLKERYSVRELLADLAGCRASRVLLFVEQSYCGALSRRLMRSLKDVNVVLLNGLPWVKTAEFWASLHPSQCLIDHLSKSSMILQLGDAALGLLNVTLAGAPCNSTPPFTEAEMRKEYMGCQNLPTALWYQKRPKSDNNRN
ncbi:uncharacterized protein LOC127658567 isoform X2 [Xyrauchen texanus]|uniref:uncharacterized protein LOC127658567 isoform X2 n=1 Tax=Xyrauchen texanus TaxID=154827 RepID=UPI002241A720|nr:uncharacterized protein LOC127658567 isoform X2 [Xyrauchen texanus]